MFLATDANADVLQETAARAARKPSRGGTANLICLAEPLDVLASEFVGLGDRVTVILPWGSLLRSLVLPDAPSVSQLNRLCAPGAGLEVVFSYDARDGYGPLGSLCIDQTYTARLKEQYESAGFRNVSVEELPQRELKAYETNWALRLAFGRPRAVWRLKAVATVTGLHSCEFP